VVGVLIALWKSNNFLKGDITTHTERSKSDRLATGAVGIGLVKEGAMGTASLGTKPKQ
jgi:hypothetical protein